MADFYPYHSFDEPLYPEHIKNSRTSFFLGGGEIDVDGGNLLMPII